MSGERARPIYEWYVVINGEESHTTQNRRALPVMKRWAAKKGGYVARRQVGWRLPFDLTEAAT